jgi:transposase-like protein
VCFEELESWVRSKVQEQLQGLLEEEVSEFLGRLKWERREGVDAPEGYRNGYGKPRGLTLSCGTIELKRPRVRETKEPFESRLLPLFAKRSRESGDLLPELYLHGLAEGDFDLALRGLLGEDAALSASTVARLKVKWQAEWEQWRSRSLAELAVCYLWVDGIYLKAGLEKDRAALLVVLGGLADGRKVVLSILPGHRESTESWSEVLRDLKQRGMVCPRLVVGDGHLGIWSALRNVFPEAEAQRCWNHKILNVLDKLPKRLQANAKPLLCRIPYTASVRQAEAAKEVFQRWCRQHGQVAAAECLERDWELLVSFYRFPQAHWPHLRTTNPIESPFFALRLRTDAARRYKKVENATAVIWKLLLVAEKRFRRLNAPEQVREVFSGACYLDGVLVPRTTVDAEEVAA